MPLGAILRARETRRGTETTGSPTPWFQALRTPYSASWIWTIAAMRVSSGSESR